jgi:hypothetical protein
MGLRIPLFEAAEESEVSFIFRAAGALLHLNQTVGCRERDKGPGEPRLDLMFF